MARVVDLDRVVIVVTSRGDGEPLAYYLDYSRDVLEHVGKRCDLRQMVYVPSTKEPKRAWQLMRYLGEGHYEMINSYTGRVMCLNIGFTANLY